MIDIIGRIVTLLNRLGLPTGASLSADIATIDTEVGVIDGIVDNILLDTQVRSITSAGKSIAVGTPKWLNIDSADNGAEILAIILNNYVTKDWTVDTYVPYVDAVAAPAAIDKRDTFSIINTDAEGGLLKPTAIAYNMFLDFTNDAGAGSETMTVTVVYRSRAALTLTWEA